MQMMKSTFSGSHLRLIVMIPKRAPILLGGGIRGISAKICMVQHMFGLLEIVEMCILSYHFLNIEIL